MDKKTSDKQAAVRTMIITIVIVLLLIFAGTILYSRISPDDIRAWLENRIDTTLFLVLMFTLPIAGVPISLFLVLLGMKFNTTAGILLAAAAMFFHMTATFYLTHSFLRTLLTRILEPFNVSVPQLDGDDSFWRIFIFMLIPGIPYALKNTLLALTGISFIPYMVINWTTQFGLSIPFIILGEAVVEMNIFIVAAAFIFLCIIYLLRRSIKKKFINSKK